MELIADTQVMSSHSYLDTKQQLNKGGTEMVDYWTDVDCVHIADDIDDCSW